jgi:hypothetical protein
MRLFLLALCAAATSPSAAQSVYPSAATVPANLLRVSIVFDAAPSVDLPPVRLRTSDGRYIEGAFYPQRLWSPDARTLTLYLDPGRVKTGLDLRETMGAILGVGQRVELCLGSRTLKSWIVGPARERPVDPRFDATGTPRRGTRDAIALSFAAPIDWQGLHLIAVAGADGRRIAGEGRLVDAERRWQFLPDRPWASGTYTLRIHPDLEDPEGNRVTTGFETSGSDRRADAREWSRRFTVR